MTKVQLNDKQLLKFAQANQRAEILVVEANRAKSLAEDALRTVNDIAELILDAAGVEVANGQQVEFDAESGSFNLIGGVPQSGPVAATEPAGSEL
jgi:hypothetical protein